jgi:hypothetical protein
MAADNRALRALLDVVLPLIAYLVLALIGASPWIALAGSTAVVIARLGWLAAHNVLTRASLLSSATFVLTALVVTLTGNRWLFLLKSVVADLILGAGILVTDKARQHSYSLDILCRLRPRRAEELRRQYEEDPDARRCHNMLTRAFGIVAIVEGLVRGIALLTLPGWVAVVASLSVAVPSVVLGTVLSLRYLAALPRRDDHPVTHGIARPAD